ncbi:glyoxalase [Aneurinibacillus migulanus]|uniref:VOC family protein n=1 Tax=Aneurinibacillus migulanus TaxID=47500 RepID=UPI0006B67737|nr:glyoxalase/bleomycin resistance/dioxygenase family protein [Aneurinibacillus migulanus]KPD10064.1 glyoxalase [Aneurinibacillus migulanus]MCP1359355.1 glyoxalase/bleomycin resistance/dioxygenase family protein [Aneurinibacillus migulanus]
MQIYKILTPIYVNRLEKALPFYEELLQTKAGTRFHYTEKKLDVAVVGQLLLISGTDEALKVVRNIALSFLVDDIHTYKTWLLDNGALIRQDITKVPTGYNMIVQQSDGTVIEYVEHTESKHVE